MSLSHHKVGQKNKCKNKESYNQNNKNDGPSRKATAIFTVKASTTGSKSSWAYTFVGILKFRIAVQISARVRSSFKFCTFIRRHARREFCVLDRTMIVTWIFAIRFSRKFRAKTLDTNWAISCCIHA